jgi:hypothetical protein
VNDFLNKCSLGTGFFDAKLYPPCTGIVDRCGLTRPVLLKVWLNRTRRIRLRGLLPWDLGWWGETTVGVGRDKYISAVVKKLA